MTDHKKEAIESLDGLGYTGDEAYVGQAQVHATLYLAEQQRIANLIAYVMLLETQYAESAKNPSEYDHATRAASVARHTLVLAQIREGMGLK
jgi:hypothetical protein